jgi:predicted AAA+ superfamily ATPase
MVEEEDSEVEDSAKIEAEVGLAMENTKIEVEEVVVEVEEEEEVDSVDLEGEILEKVVADLEKILIHSTLGFKLHEMLSRK